MAKPNYNCTEQELYTICNLAWKNCGKNLAAFTALKAKYTQIYVDAKLAAVKTASELPDEQQRNEAYETASVNLKKQARICLDTWQLLKRYIADGFPADEQKPKLEAAGHDYFRPASNDNWDSVRGLMTSGLTFINSNNAQLTAADNMPATFQNTFKGEKEEFESRHEKFLTAEEDATVGQNDKIKANNTIHAELMGMLLDGQEIFKKEEALLKQFVFAELLYLASGTGTAGFKGRVTQAGTTLGIEGVKVTAKNNNKTTETDTNGKFELNQLASGIYTISFEKEGYQPKTIENWEVKVGTVSNLNVELTPLP
ncbi:MAG: carboxypeptidase-like regulatory domain-containing protein [Chitinophagales bacterium]